MARSPFTEREAMTMIAGTVRQMIKDATYFNYSNVGPHYCQLTESGKDALCKQMDLLMGQLAHAIKHDDEERSKKIVFEQLKGN